MKRSLILHARHKRRWNGKLAGANACSYVDEGLTFKPLKNEEKNTHDIDSNGGITLAIVKKDDNTLRWGISKCNRNDTYNKRIGRAIAIGRAEKYGIITPDIEFEDAIRIGKILAHRVLNEGYNSVYSSIDGENILKITV